MIYLSLYAYKVQITPQSNAPIEYILLFYSSAAGFFIFGEVPDFLSFMGIVFIILSGIYIFISEEKLDRLAAEKER